MMMMMRLRKTTMTNNNSSCVRDFQWRHRRIIALKRTATQWSCLVSSHCITSYHITSHQMNWTELNWKLTYCLRCAPNVAFTFVCMSNFKLVAFSSESSEMKYPRGDLGSIKAKAKTKTKTKMISSLGLYWAEKRSHTKTTDRHQRAPLQVAQRGREECWAFWNLSKL